jgi:NAD(P)-dependent dehydrogenase (short-subunit alcohol dehydrogenase family)
MNPVALVTGASRGLGAEVAGFLARNGYDLVVTARGRDQLERTARDLGAFGGEVWTAVGDIADPEHRRDVVRQLEATGRLDLLVNNASGLGATPLPPLARYPLDELGRLFSVNTLAPLALVQEALPLLLRASGLVVNVTSDAAVEGHRGWGGYGATKAALDLISRTLATELQEEGVYVVSVDPGNLRTAMHQAAFPGEDISDRPPPEVTLPFWAWLLGQEPAAVSGGRFLAQGTTWEVGE